MASKAAMAPTFVALVLAFLVVVVEARLLLYGGWAWALYALTVPLGFVVLWKLLGWMPAAGIIVAFSVGVLALRPILAGGHWIVIVGLFLGLVTGLMAVRVVVAMRKPSP